jgi:hypothetical protein
MLHKITRKLFANKYQYKIVLACAGSSLFRSRNLNDVYESLASIKIDSPVRGHIKTQDDLDYAFKLCTALAKIIDADIRVESPWITIYTNSKKDVTNLANLDQDKVKYICVPPANSVLSPDTIIMPKIDYEYRVTLGKTTQSYGAFIGWASTNKKLKLTKSCAKDLANPRSWGGTYFYISGDNNLLMAKMHLGGAINKVERIVKD